MKDEELRKLEIFIEKLALDYELSGIVQNDQYGVSVSDIFYEGARSVILEVLPLLDKIESSLKSHYGSGEQWKEEDCGLALLIREIQNLPESFNTEK